MLTVAHRSYSGTLSSTIAVVCVGLALTGGCAPVVVSTPHPGTFTSIQQLNEKGSGVVYFLPKRQLKLKIDRTPQPTDLQMQLAKAKQALEDAQKGLAQASQTSAAADRLAEEVAKTNNSKATEDAAARAAEAKAKANIAQRERDAAQEKVRQLEAAVASQTAQGVCALRFDVLLTLLPPEPDPDQVYLASLDHSPFRDDDLKIRTTDQGLLTTANITATDRTADIIVELAGAIAGFLFPVPSPTTMRAETAPAKCPEPVTFEKTFDPAASDPMELNGELDSLNFPFSLDWRRLDGLPPETVTSRTLYSTAGASRIEGLLYRRQSPYQVTIYRSLETDRPGNKNCRAELSEEGALKSPSIGENCAPVQSALLLLPNQGPLGVIPFDAGLAVQTVSNATFENGILTGWDASHPSELASVVRIPVAILKAIVSVPAELIQLRFNLTSSQADLIGAQRDLLKAIEELKQTKAGQPDTGAISDASLPATP